MIQPTIYDRIYKKAEKKLRPALAPVRRSLLKDKDITIISNNCWGGVVYEWYGLQKLSPTVGMYIFADDYLKFIGALKYYLSREIDIRPARESKRYERIMSMQSEECPIGVLDNEIEIVMLHYKDPAVAREKWERRRKRVNYDNIVIKNSFMNDCTTDMLHQFDALSFDGFSPKRVMFVHRKELVGPYEVYIPGFENEEQITNDTYYFNRYFHVTRFLNDGILIPGK